MFLQLVLQWFVFFNKRTFFINSCFIWRCEKHEICEIWISCIRSSRFYMSKGLLFVTSDIHKLSIDFQYLKYSLLIIFLIPRRQTFCRSSTQQCIPISFNHLTTSLLTVANASIITVTSFAYSILQFFEVSNFQRTYHLKCFHPYFFCSS